MLCEITPVGKPGEPELPGIWPKPPVDPGYGQGIVLPPLPGIWPPPGKPNLPIVTPPINLPPGTVWPPSGIAIPPIYIPEDPAHPLPLPPGTIWPPLPSDVDPGYGITAKTAILIWVLGVGSRWYIYDPTLKPQPKPA